MYSRIKGTGSYLPLTVRTNADLEKMVDTSDEWITTRTGIHERRIAGEGDTCAHMAVEASRKAIEASGVSAEDIDLVIAATTSSEYACPSVACLVQKELASGRFRPLISPQPARALSTASLLPTASSSQGMQERFLSSASMP